MPGDALMAVEEAPQPKEIWVTLATLNVNIDDVAIWARKRLTNQYSGPFGKSNHQKELKSTFIALLTDTLNRRAPDDLTFYVGDAVIEDGSLLLKDIDIKCDFWKAIERLAAVTTIVMGADYFLDLGLQDEIESAMLTVSVSIEETIEQFKHETQSPRVEYDLSKITDQEIRSSINEQLNMLLKDDHPGGGPPTP